MIDSEGGQEHNIRLDTGQNKNYFHIENAQDQTDRMTDHQTVKKLTQFKMTDRTTMSD